MLGQWQFAGVSKAKCGHPKLGRHMVTERRNIYLGHLYLIRKKSVIIQLRRGLRRCVVELK
jgi:hypothetical protein